MNLLSASSLQRVDACPASAVLPRSVHDSPWSAKGTEIHAHLKRLAQGVSVDESLKQVPETWRSICAEIPDPGKGIAEVAFAYDVETGKVRELGRDIDRQYGKLAPTEIPGSLDFLCMVGDVLHIDDYKSGRTEVPPARENLQLHTQALMACRAYGASKARVSLVHIRDDGSTYRDAHDLDAFDLAEVADRLSRLWTRVQIAKKAVAQGKQPDVREGKHCEFCPAKNACPAKVAWLVRLGAPQGIEQRFDALLTGATARQAYEVYQRAEEVMGAIRGKLYAWARENPIDLGDGKVFGPTTFERETIDGEVAWKALESLHGTNVAMRACELTTSKAAIERALKEIAPRGSLAAFKRKALDEIAERGGIEVKVSETIKEHLPEAKDAAKVA
jgi:hypothetical protein